MLRNLPDVFRRVAVVHAKSEHESHPRSPLVLAKGGVVQGGGDPGPTNVLLGDYVVVGVVEAEVLASQPEALWDVGKVELVEDLYWPYAVTREAAGVLGVDDGERPVEAREGADKVLNESQPEAVLFCLVEVVVESRVQVAKHLRICVNVLLGRLDGVYRRFRPFGVQAGESIHGGGVSGERWRVRGKCQSRCFSRFRKLLLMKPHTRGDVLKRTAQRQRPVHSARPANDLDPRP